ncbi:hypothetical protein BDM02DRAFT_2353645 [Thelephora ganbajun]|uniref:Uncharacterized protein n=1 Tax=Thelephora ganbajun TaxID=370292 RepID=A0ACB6ZES8_THEGA|nr:hypothetical protein BDM02DRAFT_2353645 [Thelephora ganbajun]
MSRPLQLNDLPPELLGKIFGHLAVSDILGLKAVNRAFRDVVSDQPHLQYRCELAAAGLLDNPDAPETLFKRRTNLRKYRSRFDDLRPVGRSSLSLGMTGFCRGCKNFGDVHVTHATVTDRLHFCRPPSASGSRPVKTWSVPLPFEPERFAIHPPSDLVVTADNMWARLYLMTMTTGEPHPLAANRWIKHDLWPVPMHVPHTGLAVSVSDHILSAEIRGRLIAWNWRTGAKLFGPSRRSNGFYWGRSPIGC